MKLVINKCFGGFGLSSNGLKRYNELSNSNIVYSVDISRNDPNLVKVVEEMKEKANGEYASLSVVEIPDDVKWQIEEYDGQEWISEEHRTWG